ncbi:MAG: glycosyltransferase family 2 protein, partial [Cyclobacteriaceae bacterium]
MVTVIIPVYNNQDTIERAVLSVVNDPFVSEVLIVDDGSEDNSFLISQKLANKKPLIKVLHHPNRENKGASASRNLGLANATSDWIQFLDADD